MTEPVNDPVYWQTRLATAQERHHAIFRCHLDRWLEIEAKHKKILADVVWNTASVLDAGCAWGRLLDLMPKTWTGDYLGVDLSPDFIDLARKEHSNKMFRVGDLRMIPACSNTYDIAVLISIRPMIKRNLGEDEWMKMETELRRVARRLLFLEYDPSDNGSIE